MLLLKRTSTYALSELNRLYAAEFIKTFATQDLAPVVPKVGFVIKPSGIKRRLILDAIQSGVTRCARQKPAHHFTMTLGLLSTLLRGETAWLLLLILASCGDVVKRHEMIGPFILYCAWSFRSSQRAGRSVNWIGHPWPGSCRTWPASSPHGSRLPFRGHFPLHARHSCPES